MTVRILMLAGVVAFTNINCALKAQEKKSAGNTCDSRKIGIRAEIGGTSL